MKFQTPLLRIIGLMEVILATLLAGPARSEPAATAPTVPPKLSEPIPWSELGARAGAHYQGDGLTVAPTPAGARLRCVFQRLEGEVSGEGLWLTSHPDHRVADRFRVRASHVGREAANCSARALPPIGEVSLAGPTVHYIRPGLVEEYSVSMDGVRQDFLVSDRPVGAGRLQVGLAVDGAQVESAPGGANLVLPQSSRRIAYSRLRATDATGRELPAHFALPGALPGAPAGDCPAGLSVVVDDAAAVYPVRIDPTFSDANWVSLGQSSGANGYIYASAVDGAGKLYIGGAFSKAGGVAAQGIAVWDGSTWSGLGAGINGTVYAIAMSGTNVYAAGSFTFAGLVQVYNLARWNGNAWSALGEGIRNPVYALAVAGTNLYAGGDFAVAGVVPANCIAQWDGLRWSALGSGMNGSVSALAVSGANLYAGGAFTTAGGLVANHFAQWNGTGWYTLGLGMNGAVSALAVAGSNLYAGGAFTTAGGVAANHLAQWSGTGWSALGAGINGPVSALAVSGGRLYAGGAFTSAGGVVANNLAQWNGASWSAVGSGMDGSVYALALSGTNLLAAGAFTTAGGVAANHFAQWSGTGWSALGSGLNGNVLALAVSGTNLYAGGEFTSAGGLTANYVVRWNGGTWSALGAGMNYVVTALAVAGTNLYAGGAFAFAGGAPANYVARWNGLTWSALGSGMDDTVTALTVWGTNLIAGGNFLTAGGNPANHLAQWDGSTWSALGTGMDKDVRTLAVWGTNLVAGGDFTTAGGNPAKFIAQWDGGSWSAVGSGMDGAVFALAGVGGNLVAAGYFSLAGGNPANFIARWNGTSWSALGQGMDSPVLALGVAGAELYAGGLFRTAGGASANYLAQWNGTGWSPLGSGTDSPALALAVSETNLYVGGYFSAAGGRSSAYAAMANLPPPPAFAPVWLQWNPNHGGVDFAYALTGPPSPVATTAKLFWADGTNVANLLYPTPIFTTNIPVGFTGTSGTNQVPAATFLNPPANATHVLLVVDPDHLAAGPGAYPPLALGLAPVVSVQPQGATNLTASQVFHLIVAAGGAPPLAYQWRKHGTNLADGGYLSGTTNADLALSWVLAGDAGDYDVRVTNPFGSVTSSVATLALSSVTYVEAGFTPQVDSFIRATAVQPDGGIVLGGFFSAVGPAPRNHLARSQADWSPDAAFNPNVDDIVLCTAVQGDGKVLLGGQFGRVGGTSRVRLARVNSDGALDAGFRADANDLVVGLALQADGKILVAGSFTQLAAKARNRIARLNPDGTPDPGFDPNADAAVTALAIQADGRIVIGGDFASVGGSVRRHLARLNADGTLDAGFNPAVIGGVYVLAVQADGKIVLGGAFNSVAGTARNALARLNPDGTLDPGFDPNVAGTISTLALQADGRLVLGGNFTSVGGVARSMLARLNPDGSLDGTFQADANGPVAAVALQSDGKLLVGGNFTGIAGASVNYFARLVSDSATQTLTVPSAARVQWLRGGTAPEAAQVAFELSRDGLTWRPLGPGTRLPGGWELTGLGLPATGTVRARGRTAGGQFNGSSGLVEQQAAFTGLLVPRLVVEQPPGTPLTNGLAPVDFGPVNVGAGHSLTFTIRNLGAADLTGLGLTVDGADAALFTVTAYPAAPVGGTNGSTTFSVRFAPAHRGPAAAALHLAGNDPDASPFNLQLTGTGLAGPVITVQPQSATNQLGDPVVFQVLAALDPTLVYQWRKNAAPLPGATNATFTLPAVRATDAGGYDVIVGNADGAVTSQVAVLTVIVPGLAWRSLPPNFAPGDRVSVRLDVTPPPGTTSWFVREQFPGYWDFATANGASSSNRFYGELVLGPFTNDAPATLVYTLASIQELTNAAAFAGVAVFNGVTNAVAGATNLPARNEWVFVGPQSLEQGTVSGVAYGAGRWVASSFGWVTTLDAGGRLTYPRAPRYFADGWSRLAYVGGLFLLFGAGDGAQMMISPDGFSWRGAQPEPGDPYNPTADPNFDPFAQSGGFLQSVAYGNGAYVAVGEHYYAALETQWAGAIFTSTNGYNWRRVFRLLNPSRHINAVTFADHRFLAVGDRGTLLTSTNGWDWNELQPIPVTGDADGPNSIWLGTSLRGIAYGPAGWLISTARYPNGSGITLHSADGVTWDALTGTPSGGGIYWQSFYAAGKYWFSGFTDAYTTTDGTSWSRLPSLSPSAPAGPVGLAPAGVLPQFLGAGQPAASLAASSEGTTWSFASPGVNAVWPRYLSAANYGDEWLVSSEGEFPSGTLVPGDTGGNVWVPNFSGLGSGLSIRNPGAQWRQGDTDKSYADFLSTPGGLLAAGANRDHKLFASYLLGTNYVLATSAALPAQSRLVTGQRYAGLRIANVNWEYVNASFAPTPLGYDLFAETYRSGGFDPSQIYWGHFTSTNGSDWTLRPQGLNDFTKFPGVRGLAWGAGRYVAVSEGGTPDTLPAITPVISANRIYTSTDGENYLPVDLSGLQPALNGESLTGIAYGNGRFVAVGSFGRILTSTNGLDWVTVRATDGLHWNRVRYLDGTWSVVGSSGWVAFSPDGLNWTSKTAGTEADLTDIAGGNGQFMVVGSHAMVLLSTAPPPPLILTDSLVQLPGAGWQFTISGQAGKVLDIQTSPDLLNWTSLFLQTNTTGNLTVTVTDPDPTPARRFYRAVQQP